ncbi:hypothetical protein [Actinoplanes friuliensis]|uniref:Uncharacterized protein n=1 Tax=Actinoplanes friuliensis DSM 7358 TaxID=1246995 RepID=U5W3L3_9ACTN|nr:hypothetical protein [Actinoplanes friuliensis]AGZ43719.1 hypothetical protein AFR_27290 [Actinoplanes friuliensis DSM 7358]
MSDGFFLFYILMLLATAVLLSVLGVKGFGTSTLSRVLSFLIAAASLAYAVYLVFFFPGGRYTISFWAFVGPVYAVTRIVKHRKAVREQRQEQASQLWGPAGAPTFPQNYAAHPGIPLQSGHSAFTPQAGGSQVFGEQEPAPSWPAEPVSTGRHARAEPVASGTEPQPFAFDHADPGSGRPGALDAYGRPAADAPSGLPRPSGLAPTTGYGQTPPAPSLR